jgi:hypothetical protein
MILLHLFIFGYEGSLGARQQRSDRSRRDLDDRRDLSVGQAGVPQQQQLALALGQPRQRCPNARSLFGAQQLGLRVELRGRLGQSLGACALAALATQRVVAAVERYPSIYN